ncbi:MAG: hypothetical protein P8Z81_10430 [Deinococcales bacterium]
MTSFSVGEEVLFEGRRYVITTTSAEPPYRYRLVATTPEGASVAWARPEQLRKIESYTTPVDDTGRL